MIKIFNLTTCKFRSAGAAAVTKRNRDILIPDQPPSSWEGSKCDRLISRFLRISDQSHQKTGCVEPLFRLGQAETGRLIKPQRKQVDRADSFLGWTGKGLRATIGRKNKFIQNDLCRNNLI